MQSINVIFPKLHNFSDFRTLCVTCQPFLFMSIFQQQPQPKATFEVINQNVARFLSTLQSGYFLAPKNKEEEEDTYPTPSSYVALSFQHLLKSGFKFMRR